MTAAVLFAAAFLAVVPASADLPSNDLCRAAGRSSGCIDWGRRGSGRPDDTRPERPEISPEERQRRREELERSLADLRHPREERPLSEDVSSLLREDLAEALESLDRLDEKLDRAAAEFLNKAAEIAVQLASTVLDSFVPEAQAATLPNPGWMPQYTPQHLREGPDAGDKDCGGGGGEPGDDPCNDPPERCKEDDSCEELLRKRKKTLDCVFEKEKLGQDGCPGAPDEAELKALEGPAKRCGEMISSREDCCPPDVKRAKKEACKTQGQKSSCRAWLFIPAAELDAAICALARTRLAVTTGCAAARAQERDRCFGGLLDRTHRDELRKTQRNMRECQDVLDRCRVRGLGG